MLVSIGEWTVALDCKVLVTNSCQFIDQCFCLLQMKCAKHLGEPAADRRKQVAGFGAVTLVVR
jgi:hypothetical protein